MKKISIIIYEYQDLELLERNLTSLLSQTYNNIQIVIKGKDDNSNTIIKNITNNDDRVKIIENDDLTNDIRLLDMEYINGDYISFVKGDDYIDLDYYRLMLDSIENNKTEIVISNYVMVTKKGDFVTGLTYNTNNKVYSGEEFNDQFYKQTGRNDRYSFLWNKLFSISLWKKIRKELIKYHKKEQQIDELLFSVVAFNYAKSVSFCDNAIYYYSVIERKNVNIQYINDKIKSIKNTFNMINKFLTSQKKIEKYQKYIDIWEAFTIHKFLEKYNVYRKYKKVDFDFLNDQKLKKFVKLLNSDRSWNNYQELLIEYNEGFNDIKRQIANPDIKVVSFDMFDTLIVRPFLQPLDMFKLLNKVFYEYFDSIKAIDFANIRVKSEIELRKVKLKEDINEITFDQIYDYISKRYNLDRKKLEKIKQKEVEMELQFCYRRNSGYELYSLAKHLNKKVVLTSDIYLPQDLLIKILKKNGYEFDAYYVSSETFKTKAYGEVFDYLKEKEKTDKILHIGDNYISDYTNAKEHGIEAARLIKASDVLFGYSPIKVNNCGYLYKYFASFNIDNIPYEACYGVRSALGIVANYYFDNPFRPFSDKSDFNGDPYFVGFYTVGMQIVSICKWLYEDITENKIDSISFMARDGYLPYEALKIFEEKTHSLSNVKFNYTYVSRKSLMPLLLKDKAGISVIDTYLDYSILTPSDLMLQFKNVIDISEKNKKKISKHFELDECFENIEDFNECLSLIYDYCYNKEKYDNYYNMCKKYFDQEFPGNPSTFDVGYSGKPEAIISSIINKPLTTYFIHTNNTEGFKNSKLGEYKLKTFYDFKPTISGALRELFISYVGPSCIGYDYKGEEVVPIFGKEKNYSFYNIDMIKKVQESSLDFVRIFYDFFSQYFEEMDLDKYYMSVPMEYYYHYAKEVDKYPIKDLLFEANVNQFVELNDFILDIKKNYTREYCKGDIPEFEYEDLDIMDYTIPKSRTGRVIHYAFKDRKKLKSKWKKWKKKSENPETLPNSRAKRLVYYAIFDRGAIKRKIRRKK